jgi:hypothetical protein
MGRTNITTAFNLANVYFMDEAGASPLGVVISKKLPPIQHRAIMQAV